MYRYLILRFLKVLQKPSINMEIPVMCVRILIKLQANVSVVFNFYQSWTFL